MASAAAQLAEMKRQQQEEGEMQQQEEEEMEQGILTNKETENEGFAAAVAAATPPRTPYRLPCAAAVGLPFVREIRAKGLGIQVIRNNKDECL